MKNRVILHVDMNNFYASVESIYRPELIGLPIAVAGDPANRHGIILAKNQLAKKAGVKTAEAIWEAKQKCPDLVCVPPNYDRYILYSNKAREMYSQYTHLVEPFGLDECWLDITGSDQDGYAIAEEIRCRIKDELSLTVSIGLSYNKIFAKLGSDYKKPDAITIIPQNSFREIVWPLPVSDLLMVGSSTTKKLNKININTIGELAKLDPQYIEQSLKKPGIVLWQFANGLDGSIVRPIGYLAPIKSIGNGLTTPSDLTNWDAIKQTVFPLAEKVASRLRELNVLSTTIQIGIRNSELYGIERQKQARYPIRTSKEISSIALELIGNNIKAPYNVRALTIRATQLIPEKDLRQLTLFVDQKDSGRQEQLETAMDVLRLRFGNDIIKRAIMLKPYLNLKPFSLPEQRIHPTSFMR